MIRTQRISGAEKLIGSDLTNTNTYLGIKK